VDYADELNADEEINELHEVDEDIAVIQQHNQPSALL
jgi:hypothetical protein